jgi:hypothetical protein
MCRSEPWTKLNHLVQKFTYSSEMSHDTENKENKHNDTQHNNKQMPLSA